MRASPIHPAAEPAAPTRTELLRWRAPGVLGAGLLFWGACVDMLWFAVPLAIVAELPPLTKWRWRLDRRDFDRVCDLTAILLLLLALYKFDRDGVRGIYGMLAWSPLAFAALLLAQVYSTRDEVSYASLFYSVRRAERRGLLDSPGALDLRPTYFALCLLAAATLGGPGSDSAAAMRPFYLPGCMLLLCLALFAHRPRRAPLVWLLAVLLAAGAAWFAAGGVIKARRALEPLVMSFMHEYVKRWRDPFRGHISLGDVGSMKNSEGIVARVRPALGRAPPRLLREASYQSFSHSLWMSRSRHYGEVPSEGDGERWTLHAPPAAAEGAEHNRTETARIAMSLRRGRGLLPVPPGTEQLSNLPVEQVFSTELDVIKVERGPGVIEFDARFSRSAGYGAPASGNDLVVPAHLESVVERYQALLGLSKASPGASAAQLTQWFNSEFEYSLEGFRNPRRSGDVLSPLQLFLDDARRGHCELFATATVMLLRGAGIPARYVVGYAVDEWSELEQAYVVRRRHGHAWAEMWDGARWQVVDTTPAIWYTADAAGSAWWHVPRDWLSWAWFRFMRWRWLTDRGTWFDHLPWLVPPLLGLLVWRLARRQRTRRADAVPGLTAGPPERGADSEFFAVAAALERRSDTPRRAFETLRSWVNRVGRACPQDPAVDAAAGLLPAHDQLRFDPRGLDVSSRQALASGCHRWLLHHAGGRIRASLRAE